MTIIYRISLNNFSSVNSSFSQIAIRFELQRNLFFYDLLLIDSSICFQLLLTIAIEWSFVNRWGTLYSIKYKKHETNSLWKIYQGFCLINFIKLLERRFFFLRSISLNPIMVSFKSSFKSTLIGPHTICIFSVFLFHLPEFAREIHPFIPSVAYDIKLNTAHFWVATIKIF